MWMLARSDERRRSSPVEALLPERCRLAFMVAAAWSEDKGGDRSEELSFREDSRLVREEWLGRLFAGASMGEADDAAGREGDSELMSGDMLIRTYHDRNVHWLLLL